ncbi:BatA domain-containing protein [Siphonobacter sp. SORGH_AS_1065]|uniref:BatA domain-containing protein n=1 Tax=Siphonobacter sp. SORGH_AS_1065 TaxID=3041795 RepID=UPI00278A48A0|nr:BatA domain-containing protein [Siphonobacter sp. SORGH_AS_1065]MDQ1085900.1 hypothetical protein [Siphonobacter sp. SORGH_AS_1065]
MQFLYPAFLWGLLAAAIPVLIHLFNFRRIKRVYFTNVSFLKQVNTTTSSFRRLKHWLIMAARIGALVCLALAFAQPFIPASKSTGVSRDGITSIYLDNSLSMQNLVDNRRLLDVGVSKIEELLNSFPNAPMLQLVTNDFGAQEHALQGSQKIRDRLATVDFSPSARSLESIYRRQQQLASAHSAGKNQLFWLSDFQKSTVGDLQKIKPDSSTQLFLVPVQGTTTQNVFVDTLWLNTPFIREMQSNVVTVRLRNSGTNPVENLSVKLLLDDKQVASQIVSIPAENYVQTAFNFTVRGKGFKKGRITFEDSPVTFDNDYYFVLNAAPRIDVLHVYGQKTKDYVQNVFSNDSLFREQSFSVNNVDIGTFQSANLIVLEGVERVEGSLRAELQRFVDKGGSLLVIPPARVSDASWLTALGIQNISSVQGEPSTPTILAEPSRQNPFFSDIFDETTQKEQLIMPAASSVWSWRMVGEKLLNFKSGEPFLTSSKAGQGRVYLMASSLDPSLGDFAQHALFLPILYKIASLSVRQEPIAYSFESPDIQIDAPGSPKNAVFKLRKDKLELIPIQRMNGNQLTFELPKSEQLTNGQPLESGYYELILDGKVTQLLAFNHDDKESNMQVYSPQKLRDLFKGNRNVQVFDNVNRADVATAYKEQHVGKDLWKYFIITALVFLLCEIAIVRLMKA